ncbi:MAG: hypothetical protein AAF288_02590 [Planctomycetota bacterium]
MYPIRARRVAGAIRIAAQERPTPLLARFEYDAYGRQHAYGLPAPGGDFNGDGSTDLLDFDVLAANFNQSGGFHEGDGNYDGTVTLLDFDAMAQNFGRAGSDPAVLTPTGMPMRAANGDLAPLASANATAILGGVGFQGLFHDEELGGAYAGGGLIHNRARMLHTGLGRFAQRDPIGYPDGMSGYSAYHVMQMALDPSGLTKLSECQRFLNYLRSDFWYNFEEQLVDQYMPINNEIHGIFKPDSNRDSMLGQLSPQQRDDLLGLHPGVAANGQQTFTHLAIFMFLATDLRQGLAAFKRISQMEQDIAEYRQAKAGNSPKLSEKCAEMRANVIAIDFMEEVAAVRRQYMQDVNANLIPKGQYYPHPQGIPTTPEQRQRNKEIRAYYNPIRDRMIAELEGKICDTDANASCVKCDDTEKALQHHIDRLRATMIPGQEGAFELGERAAKVGKRLGQRLID